ncbi:MAG: DUF2809 domain-containing protein [Methylococcaceae bacterium]|nr:DUF2809 domain-containing protein [Methylococcaceae bacterium]
MIKITSSHRNRLLYLVAVVMVVAIGIASRKFSGLFPLFLGKYPGDALWALMVFLLIGLLCPALCTYQTALFAVAISFTVEFSQLYQALWINTIRQTTLGHLVLGSHFHTVDLLAYLLGVSFGAILEWLLRQYANRVGANKFAPTQSN